MLGVRYTAESAEFFTPNARIGGLRTSQGYSVT